MNDLNNPDEILGHYGNLVYQLALARTKNPTDTDDVFQEVFLRLVRKKRRFESEEHLKAWLIRVTINCSRSLWRSAWNQRTVPFESDIPAAEEQGEPVYSQVMALPVKYRTIIHLFYYEDMPIDKISRALGISYTAAAKRLSRARQLLKLKLEGEEEYREYSKRLPRQC